MNRKQRIILLAGVIVFTLLGLFPPWKFVSLERYTGSFDTPVTVIEKTTLAGYYFIYQLTGAPPLPKNCHDARIDLSLLLAEWRLVIGATTGLFLLLKKRKRE